MSIERATYSPEDNKIRLYPFERLDAELYTRVKAAGYKWAPRQELFVAPMWTPGRAALAEELAGFISDEDTSLVERSEERAERFEDYSDKRAEDANREFSAIADAPTLVASHDPRRADKEAKRIERGRERALKAFDTSEYWTRRAAGAIRNAKYKELPAVRARRIKKIEADKRKQERHVKEAETILGFWALPGLTMERAVKIAGGHSGGPSKCFTLAEYPRELPASQYEGSMSVYSALYENVINYEQARDIETKYYTAIIRRAGLWIEHYDNRLAYETAMLNEQGGADLLKPKARPVQLPICNYLAPEGVMTRAYGKDELLQQVAMTKEEYKRVYCEQRGTRTVEGSHRVRIAMIRRPNEQWGYDTRAVFLADSKEHKKPAPAAPVQDMRPAPTFEPRKVQEAPSKVNFDPAALKERGPVRIAVADQLFATPRGIAERMADIIDAQPGDKILEPSGGTGQLVGALGGVMFSGGGCLDVVEVNRALCSQLQSDFPLSAVFNQDFLEFNPLFKYDKIIMNPPFKNGVDIKHIEHARGMLAPGGVLVALCANGPRQRDQLRPLADHWESLPPGSFKEAGTNVNVAMLIIRN